MQNYEVTLRLTVNPSRDINLPIPETKQVTYFVKAETERHAITIAKDFDDSKLSVYESWANEEETVSI